MTLARDIVTFHVVTLWHFMSWHCDISCCDIVIFDIVTFHSFPLTSFWSGYRAHAPCIWSTSTQFVQFTQFAHFHSIQCKSQNLLSHGQNFESKSWESKKMPERCLPNAHYHLWCRAVYEKTFGGFLFPSKTFLKPRRRLLLLLIDIYTVLYLFIYILFLIPTISWMYLRNFAIDHRIWQKLPQKRQKHNCRSRCITILWRFTIQRNAKSSYKKYSQVGKKFSLTMANSCFRWLRYKMPQKSPYMDIHILYKLLNDKP